MRIVCPNCGAAYEVPETVLAPDRPVRCARCGQDWAPVEPPASPPPAVRPVAPAASPDPEAAPAAGAPALDLRRVRSQPVVPLPPASGEPPPALDAPMPPPALAAPAPPPALDAPTPPPAADAPMPRAAPRVHAPVLIGWVLSALVLLGAAWASHAWRVEIMRAWPPSTRLYTVLGLTQG